MKIALIGKYGEGDIVGGPERVGRELFCELQKKGIDVTFIEYFFSGYEDYSLLKKIAGSKIISRNIYRLGIIQLIILLNKEKYDLIHLVNSQRFQLVILFLKPLLKIKIIATLHGTSKIELKGRIKFLQKKYFLDIWVENLIIKKSDLSIFPSELLFNQFQKGYGISKDKALIIPNGITNKFIFKDNQFSFNGEFNLIFYNGFNSILSRGLDSLIEQLSAVKKIKFNLFVLGNADKKYKNQRNVNIIFMGFLDQNSLIDFCRNKQFIIKSNTFDSFSILVLECMAQGVIPIITNNIGVKDYIINGKNGFIYKPHTQYSLSNVFEDINDLKDDLKVISDNARKTAKAFNWTEITKKYLDAYKTVI